MTREPAEIAPFAPFSVPGKLILFGEHAVMHGHLGVAIPFPRAVEISCDGFSALTTIEIPDFRLTVSLDSSPSTRLGYGLRDIIHAFQLTRTPKISVTPLVPASSGLGVSAAIAVGVCRALQSLSPRQLSSDELGRRVLLSEAHVHGSPSGIDHMTILLESAVLKQDSQFKCSRLPTTLNFAIIHTGERVSTRRMIARTTGSRVTTKILRIIDQIGAISERGLRALQKGDLRSTGALMTDNHCLLADLGVSSEIADRVVLESLATGALGAKVTGSGGGGAVVALCRTPQEAMRIVHRFQDTGYSGFTTSYPFSAGLPSSEKMRCLAP